MRVSIVPTAWSHAKSAQKKSVKDDEPSTLCVIIDELISCSVGLLFQIAEAARECVELLF
ncbi:Unannotated [Lentimonas sp. CC19]|nr:Unannotated [Lentimonas sp. CC19]CAA6695056.1 Unannotated [Lentimonas sp. CC10]CAA7069660.1 Unannotated [Lentimonas sp. CC11]